MDNKRDYPRFGRTITSDTAIGSAVVELWVELGLAYGAVVHVSGDKGVGYAEAVFDAARMHNQLVVRAFPFDAESEEQARAH